MLPHILENKSILEGCQQAEQKRALFLNRENLINMNA